MSFQESRAVLTWESGAAHLERRGANAYTKVFKSVPTETSLGVSLPAEWERRAKDTTMRNREEAQLSRTFFEYLQGARPRCVYTAVPNGGSRSLVEAVNLKRQGVIPGAGDWVFTWNGGSGWIELKTEKGMLTPNQMQFKAACEHLGVEYEVARSLDDCIEILRKWERL